MPYMVFYPAELKKILAELPDEQRLRLEAELLILITRDRRAMLGRIQMLFSQHHPSFNLEPLIQEIRREIDGLMLERVEEDD